LSEPPWWHCPYEEIEFQRSPFNRERPRRFNTRRFDPKDCGRVHGRRPGTRAQQLAAGALGDSVGSAEATEAISYGIPVFKYKGPLVWFAAFSNHCSLFPGASVIKAFANELKGYKTSKGTIHFPVDKALSAALVKKMVKARLAEKAPKKPR
jgi:hypothetical protein